MPSENAPSRQPAQYGQIWSIQRIRRCGCGGEHGVAGADPHLKPSEVWRPLAKGDTPGGNGASPKWVIFVLNVIKSRAE